MTVTPLFCIAEEAKSYTPTILSLLENHFSLVESQECPSDKSGLKSKLADNEDFDTAFAGASVEDCQNWILEQQDTAMFIEPNIIGIADARTAKDGTILMTWYRDREGENCPRYGVLPPKADAWWDFRVRPEQAPTIIAYLNFVASDVSFPLYFGRKEEFTDENGIFDAVKAEPSSKIPIQPKRDGLYRIHIGLDFRSGSLFCKVRAKHSRNLYAIPTRYTR